MLGAFENGTAVGNRDLNHSAFADIAEIVDRTTLSDIRIRGGAQVRERTCFIQDSQRVFRPRNGLVSSRRR